MSDTLAVSTTLIGLAINAMGLIFIATQVVLARRQLRDNSAIVANENARVRRQATIDFYMATLDRVSEWRSLLPDDWDSKAIDQYVSNAYVVEDHAKLGSIATYLAYFEALAVAVRSDIYDLRVLDSMAGSRIMNISANYHKFFELRRRQVGAETAYRNLEWLGGEIRMLRGSANYGDGQRPANVLDKLE